MKINSLSIFIMLLQIAISFSVRAQHVSNDNGMEKEVVNIFYNEQLSFHCERYKKLNEFMRQMSEDELSAHIDFELFGYKILLKSSEISLRERKMIRSQVTILKKLRKYRSKSEGLKRFTESVCKVSELGGIGLGKGIAWTSNGIMTTLATPFQAIGKLTRGLITGKVREGNGEIQYDFLGPSYMDGSSKSLLFSKRYLSLALTHPLIFPLLVAPVVDSEVMKICKRKHSLTREETKFCSNYVDFKMGALKLTRPFEIFGAKIHHLFSKKKPQEEDSAPYTQDEILKDLTKLTEENLCEKMIEIGKKFKKSKRETRRKSDLETWRIGTNPERYGMPDVIDFITNKENLIVPKGPTKIFKNVVISLGPTKWQTEGLDTKQIINDYRRQFNQLKKKLKTGRKIFQNANTVEQCEDLKKKHNFNYNDVEELAILVDENALGRRLFENKKIRGLFQSKAAIWNLFDSTKMKWEFIENGDIETIGKVIRSKDVANVIMVIHGTEKGKIIDSHLNEIPRTFFRDISPSIVSLNFFSCYSQKIEHFYSLSKEFSSAKTYHLKRHISFIEQDPSYSYQKGQVPFEAFAGYFSKLDHLLHLTTKGNLLFSSLAQGINIEKESQTCEIHVYNLGQKKSTFSVTVNNTYVGSVAGSREKSRFEFDCNILNDLNNNLRFLNVNTQHSEPLNLEKAHIYVIHPEKLVQINMNNLNQIKVKENVIGITGTF